MFKDLQYPMYINEPSKYHGKVKLICYFKVTELNKGNLFGTIALIDSKQKSCVDENSFFGILYNENGRIINTETRIPIQVYDKNDNLVEDINNNTNYYDINGICIPEEEIIIPKEHKILNDKERNQVIVPNEYKFSENIKGELI